MFGRSHTAGRADSEYVAEHREERAPVIDEAAHAEFGGANVGAAFFGWLVAMALAILLTSIVGAVATAVREATEVTQSDAERQAGTIGIVAAVVLLGVLTIGYYAGGYVAGRMSRFDGARQGATVWVLGLVLTVIALGVGAAFGAQYNVLDRVDLPRIPISTEELGWGGLVTGAAVLLLTLAASVAGGMAGHRYHHRVDRVLHES
jgi:amino acid transporter